MNMKYRLILLLFGTLLTITNAFAQYEPVRGNRLYSIGVLEMDEYKRDDVNNKIYNFSEQHNNVNKRGAFMATLLAANRSAIVTKIASTAEDILGVTISHLSEDIRSPRKKWEEVVNSECRFSKSLGMIEDIKDFYAAPSTRSALDVANIMFDGFSCKQDIKVGKDTINVFYISCKLDTSKIDRMISHSKFEVIVDSVRFNPYLCDIPNDSLIDVSKRIAFDFRKREDLRFKMHAIVTSSWMNEAVMIFANQKLGEFDIEIQIDSSTVINNPEHVYTYKAGKDSTRSAQVNVTGESFIVPRSFCGNDEEGHSLWGTGQYKIDMLISESCKINQSFYQEKAQGKSDGRPKWNNNWKPEWKLISSRPKNKSIWREFGMVITSRWTGRGWLTEITSPTTSCLIRQGSTYLNGGVAIDEGKSMRP